MREVLVLLCQRFQRNGTRNGTPTVSDTEHHRRARTMVHNDHVPSTSTGTM